MKNKLIYSILIIVCGISNSFSQYVKNPDGSYAVSTYQIYLSNYNPGRPANQSILANPLNLVLNITADITEATDSIYRPSSSGLKLYIYAPTVISGSSAKTNPLQVIVFGVGNGFNSSWFETVSGALPRYYASLGYIVVCPDYRLGIDLQNTYVNLAPRAIWRGIQDVRRTIAVARQFSTNTYGNNSYYGSNKPLVYIGHSSGAVIGLHNLYLNNTNKPSYVTGDLVAPVKMQKKYNLTPIYANMVDLGTLDNAKGFGTTLNNSFTETSGSTNDTCVPDITIALSGGLGDLNYITNSTNSKPKALLMIHDPSDGVVPYGNGNAFKWFTVFWNPGFNYPPLLGSSSIDNYFNSNPSNKPSIYSFLYMNSSCNSNDCIKGSSGGLRYIDAFPIWYHNVTSGSTINPLDVVGNTTVMNTITNFITTSTSSLTSTSRSNNINAKIQLDKKLIDPTNLTIYPNPVSGDFMNITAIDNNTPYAIYNVAGQEVSTGKVNNGTINVAKLSKGNYLLQVQVNDQRIVKQFIKQ